MLYVQGVLPLLMPLAVLLMEPSGWRRLAVAACTVVGAVVFAWTTYAVVAFPSRSFIEHQSIAYRNPMTGSGWVAGAYVVATCGALLLSIHRVVRWFGILNVVGLTIVMIVRGYAFTSVWCLYAAVLSMMLFWQFSRRHIDIADPNSSVDRGTEWQTFKALLSGRETRRSAPALASGSGQWRDRSNDGPTRPSESP